MPFSEANLERLRAAVDSSPSGLLMIDGEGRIVLVNREIERLFGYERAELLGEPVDILVPERLRERHPAFRAGFVNDPKSRAMGAGRDLYGRRKDGSEVPVEIGLTPVRTEEGLFVLSSIVDITARKQAEARFRIAVESSPSGMLMTDMSGRIVLVNRAVERMFGWRRDELLGQNLEVLVPERFRSAHPAYRNRFFADPRERPMGAGRDLFGLRRDGTEFAVEIGLNPITTDEGTVVLASVVDISARKQAEEQRNRLEEQLRQSQKLEAVGTLAGGIAHDFRNILNGIIGFAELLRDPLAGSAAQADLDEVLRFASRGGELVSRILTFSRREEAVRRPTELQRTIRDAVKLLRATLPSSIDIRTDLRDEAPPVLADPTSVHQVVMNLGTNAAHAMPNGGTLSVAVEPFYVRDSVARANPDLHEGPHTLLVVRDTGTGIPPDVLPRVFEPFFTTKRAGQGTGLGLAMVHGIMRDHGGAVRLESQPREGTVVRCYFPALARGEEAEQAEVSGVPRGHGERILFVDDEPALATIGERRLRSLGYEVTPATESAAAIALCTADPGRFDLVVTDYTMPEKNGLELARELTRINPEIPIILASGYVEQLPETALREAGVRVLLMKPVTTAELAQAVASVLAARKPWGTGG